MIPVYRCNILALREDTYTLTENIDIILFILLFLLNIINTI